MGRAFVSFAGNNKVHGVSISRHLLVRVEVCSESTMAFFESGAVLNVTSREMVKKSHLCTQPTNRSIKVANCASERWVGELNEVLMSMGG